MLDFSFSFSQLYKKVILIIAFSISIVIVNATNLNLSIDIIYFSNSDNQLHDSVFVVDSVFPSVNTSLPIKKSIINDNSNLVNRKISVHRAALYSAIIPGLGQAYNHRYWKIPIIYAIGAGLLYDYNKNNKSYRNSQKMLNDKYYITPIGNKDDIVSNKYRMDKDKSRKRMERDALLLGLLYIANVVDALVDSYFYNFDISGNLSITPTIINTNNLVLTESSFGLAISFAIR